MSFIVPVYVIVYVSKQKSLSPKHTLSFFLRLSSLNTFFVVIVIVVFLMCLDFSLPSQEKTEKLK